MIQIKYLILLIASCFVLSETAYVESLNKCSVKDNECLKSFFQSLLIQLSESGVPELGIDKIDPLDVSDTTVSILGVLDLTAIKGTVEGTKQCRITAFEFNVEEGKTTVKALCDRLLIQGIYKTQGKGDLFKGAGVSGDIKGEGNGKITLDKVEVQMDLYSHMEKHDDGNIYLKLEADKTAYDLKNLGKATFEADNLVIGDNNASKEIIKFMNDNWKVLMESFGKPFLSEAVKFVTIICNKFLKMYQLNTLLKKTYHRM